MKTLIGKPCSSLNLETKLDLVKLNKCFSPVLPQMLAVVIGMSNKTVMNTVLRKKSEHLRRQNLP